MLKTTAAFGLLSTLAFTALCERDASACGGCFHPPNENASVITDHRMILSISPQQTTLYDQIRYQGSPSSFAWVLPINGAATVGLSSDTLFETLDQQSTTTIVPPDPGCPSYAPCPYNGAGTAGGFADAGATAEDGGVIVSHQQVVGPYETVQLHSTDPNALGTWLTSHGFAIPSDVQPIVAAYVNEHFDFLAMKLVPGAGVQAMRPVRVTTAGASPVLPLRMVAAGTGATVGITLWVVADGRYETENFPWFRILDSDIVWDWPSNSSNYRALRAQREAAANGAIWELESSMPASASAIGSQVRYGNLQQDYPAVPPSDAGSGESSDQLLAQDMAAIFGTLASDQFRLTRLRADLAHAALANDLVLRASTDQSTLSSLRRPTATSGTPNCPSAPQCTDPGGNPFPTDPVGPGASGSSSKESFSCATSSSSASGDALLTYASIAALLGFGFVRSRRRRSL